MKKLLIGGLSALLLTTTVASFAAAPTPEEQIKLRKAGYSYVSWNMAKIKSQVVDKDVAYDKAQVEAAANTIAAIANSGMSALYGPGTDKAIGDEYTNVRPELFQNPQEVARLAKDFSQASIALAEKAAGGDQAAIASALGDLGNTCKACHDQFKKK